MGFHLFKYSDVHHVLLVPCAEVTRLFPFLCNTDLYCHVGPSVSPAPQGHGPVSGSLRSLRSYCWILTISLFGKSPFVMSFYLRGEDQGIKQVELVISNLPSPTLLPLSLPTPLPPCAPPLLHTRAPSLRLRLNLPRQTHIPYIHFPSHICHMLLFNKLIFTIQSLIQVRLQSDLDDWFEK